MPLVLKSFKRLHYSVEIIAQCLRWYLVYSLSLRNLKETMAERGIFKFAPRSSFRNTGEQIEGSFRMNDDFYLMEAKWHQNRTPAADVHVFEGKLSTKAIWAWGVFISRMGFTDEGLTSFGKGKRVICFSGYDLYHSRSHGIAMPNLLEATLRHAAETGEPYAELDRLYTLKDKIPGTPE